MRPFTRPFFTACLALTLAGCNSLGLGTPPAAPAASAAIVPPPAPTPTSSPITGVLAGPLAADIDESDRRAAFIAQNAGLDSGLRRTWKGAHGTFGFVEPGPEGQRAEGVCRDYALTLYVAGRPRSAKGLACREASGNWRIAS